jgi:hypothetical protein
MRLVAVLVALAALVAGGWLLYTRVIAPEKHACARVADRCNLADGQTESCERLVREVRKAGGSDAGKKLASCLAGAESCADAAGCAAGVGTAVFSSAMLEFLDGLRRAR